VWPTATSTRPPPGSRRAPTAPGRAGGRCGLVGAAPPREVTAAAAAAQARRWVLAHGSPPPVVQAAARAQVYHKRGYAV
jgi:hypothetical protein